MWCKFREMASKKTSQSILKEYDDITQELIDNGVKKEECKELFIKIAERRADVSDILITKYKMIKNEADYLVGRIIDNYNDMSDYKNNNNNNNNNGNTNNNSKSQGSNVVGFAFEVNKKGGKRKSKKLRRKTRKTRKNRH